jgi:hypothetical protein
MTDVFLEDDFKRLSDVQKATCLSIYIPTHEAGMEVNENLDMIAFRNEVKSLQNKLEDLGYDDEKIEALLRPALQLLDDLVFWKNQSSGLAVFMMEGFFRYFRLPVPFHALSLISSRFIVTPIIPALDHRNIFFILSLNKYEFHLFACNGSGIREMEIEEEFRKKAEDALLPIDYLNDFHEPLAENRDSQVLQRTKEKGDVNVPGFFKAIDEIVAIKFKDMGEPLLVLAGVEEWQGDYRKVSRYKNLYDKGFDCNIQSLSPRELHEKVMEIIKPYFEKAVEAALLKYHMLAGTGKTSYNLHNILFDVTDGRVDILFIPKETYIWGRYDEKENELLMAEGPGLENYCILNYAAVTAIKNKGKIFMLDKNRMPEDAPLVAVYRY